MPKIKFDSAAEVIRLSGVSEPTKRERVVEAIVARLRTLGFKSYLAGHAIVWYTTFNAGGRVSVYEDGNVVGNLPAEYYL